MGPANNKELDWGMVGGRGGAWSTMLTNKIPVQSPQGFGLSTVKRVWRLKVALQVRSPRGCKQRLLCHHRPLSLTEEDAMLYPTSVLSTGNLLVCRKKKARYWTGTWDQKIAMHWTEAGEQKTARHWHEALDQKVAKHWTKVGLEILRH